MPPGCDFGLKTVTSGFHFRREAGRLSSAPQLIPKPGSVLGTGYIVDEGQELRGGADARVGEKPPQQLVHGDHTDAGLEGVQQQGRFAVRDAFRWPGRRTGNPDGSLSCNVDPILTTLLPASSPRPMARADPAVTVWPAAAGS